MKRKLNVSDITPQNDNVLLDINLNAKSEIISEKEFTRKNTEVYEATVIALGDNSMNKDSGFEGLLVGDKVIVNKHSGVTAPTDSTYSKVVRGYDVLVRSTEDWVTNSFKPHPDRLVVEILDRELVNEGDISYESSFDPRERETQKGRILSCGKDCKQYAPGTVVFFDPFCGTMILNTEKEKIKVVFNSDILFTA